MKEIIIKRTGKTVSKSDFVADLFVRKGLAEFPKKKKELKEEMETKELKVTTKKKKK